MTDKPAFYVSDKEALPVKCSFFFLDDQFPLQNNQIIYPVVICGHVFATFWCCHSLEERLHYNFYFYFLAQQHAL